MNSDTRRGHTRAGCAIVMAALAAAFAQPGVAATCADACLSQIMHGYLSHLLTHDPKGLPLAPTVATRENAVNVALGDGVWKSVSAIHNTESFTDAVTQQVVSYSAVDAAGAPGALFVRLKVIGGRIAESEITFNGATNVFSNPVNLREPDLLYGAVVPAARRVPRAQLIGIVNAYLDGISAHDGSKVPFSYRCDRYASGSKVTNSPDHPADKQGGTCAGSMDHLTGQLVVNRRFAVIDVERGVVAAFFLIPHLERPAPGSTHVSELFKIVDGKIRSIEEFSFGGGAPPDSGFEGDIETGTPDTPRGMNMHPSPEFLQGVLSGPAPIPSIELPQFQTGARLTVQSSTLQNNAFPTRNTGWGDSISPEVSWSAGPAGTRSYVLIMEDGTVGMKRQGVLHWLAFNIPSSVTELPEGLPTAPAGLLMGANQAGDSAYTGPHSPAGAPVFHYHIQVFALDAPLALAAGAHRDAVLAAMSGHVIAKGELVASFQGPAI